MFNIELLIVAQSILLWSFASYAITTDPTRDDQDSFGLPRYALLFVRTASVFAVSFAFAQSFLLAASMSVIVAVMPLARYRIPSRFGAEFEFLACAIAVATMILIIKHLHLTSMWTGTTLKSKHVSALCLIAAIFLVALRGGSYMVRGILNKAGTLPHLSDDSSPVDETQIRYGRIIGNLERTILTIVVAGGSYSALGFLIAAKGLIRFEEAKREFTEYFLIGSFSSVLVALFAGLAIRILLINLWPELLSLKLG